MKTHSYSQAVVHPVEEITVLISSGIVQSEWRRYCLLIWCLVSTSSERNKQKKENVQACLALISSFSWRKKNVSDNKRGVMKTINMFSWRRCFLCCEEKVWGCKLCWHLIFCPGGQCGVFYRLNVNAEALIDYSQLPTLSLFVSWKH